MHKTSIQLSTRERPTSFDYSNDHQLLVLSSCNDLSYYYIPSQSNDEYTTKSFTNANTGSPCHVIHYEQSNFIKQTKMQIGIDHLVASLKDTGSVSVYDYNTKSIRPLVDFIPSSFAINDINWSPHSSQLLASTSDSNGGMVNLWDIRTTIQPIQQYVLEQLTCNLIEWCPYNSNLISARCNSSYLAVIDVRMMGNTLFMLNNNQFNENSFNKQVEYHNIHMLSGKDTIIDSYAWDLHSESIFILDRQGNLENHCILHDFVQGRLGSTRAYPIQPSLSNRNSLQSITKATRLIPDPYGISFAIATNLDATLSSYQYNHHVDYKSHLNRISYTDPSCIYLTTIKDIIQSNNPIRQHSFESYSPSSNASFYLEDLKEVGTPSVNKEIFTEIARSNTSLLDIKWIYPTQSQVINGTYVSSLHLLTLNTNSLVQIIHMHPSNPNIDKDSILYDLHRNFSTITEPATSNMNLFSNSDLLQLLPHPQNQQQLAKATHKYSIHTMKHSIGVNSSDENKHILSHNNIPGASSIVNNINSKTNDTSKRNSRSLNTTRLNIANATTTTINQHHPQNQQSVVGPITFNNLIEEDIYAIEYGISHGYLEGYRISRIDQFTRKIYLELLIPNIDSYTITNKSYATNFASYYRSEDLHSFYNSNNNTNNNSNNSNFINTNKKHLNNLRTIELVIIFPIKYHLFWNPLFTAEDKTGLEFNMDAINAILLELTSMCRSFIANDNKETLHKNISGSNNNEVPYIHKKLNITDRNETSGAVGLNYSDCLLFQIIRYFRKKLFKLWENIIESNRLSLSLKNLNNQGGNSSLDSKLLLTNAVNELNEECNNDSYIATDPHAPYMKYIEDLAYKVPIPVLSAGIFNAKGQLICFGKAKIDSLLNSNSPVDIIIGGSNNDLLNTVFSNNEISGGGKSYHKSFASTLISKIINTTSLKHSNHSLNRLPNNDILCSSPTVGLQNPNEQKIIISSHTDLTPSVDNKESETLQFRAKNVSFSQLSSNGSITEKSCSDESQEDDEENEETETEIYDFQFQLETEKKHKPKSSPVVTVKMDESMDESKEIAEISSNSRLNLLSIVDTQPVVSTISPAVTIVNNIAIEVPSYTMKEQKYVDEIDSIGSYFIGDDGCYIDGTKYSTNKSRLSHQRNNSIEKLPNHNSQLLMIYKVAYSIELKLVFNYAIGDMNSIKKRISSTTTDQHLIGTSGTVVSTDSTNPSASNCLIPKMRNRARTRSTSNSKLQINSNKVVNDSEKTHNHHQINNDNNTITQMILTNEEAHNRAKTCRFNAKLIRQILPYEIGLSQFWNMLGVVLDMFTISDSGALIDWNNSSLGCSLLFRLFLYLKETWDIQTYATAICVIGGSDVFTSLLESAYKQHQNTPILDKNIAVLNTKGSCIHIFTMIFTDLVLFMIVLCTIFINYAIGFDLMALKREMNFVLYTYADILHRWNEHLYATEIIKYINYQYLPNHHMQLHLPDSNEYLLCVRVACMNCEQEIVISEYSNISTPASNYDDTHITMDSKKIPHKHNNDSNKYNNDNNSKAVVNPSNQVLINSLWCQNCQDWAQRCVLCEMAVRGPISVCTNCGHGGHFNHMQQWFAKSNVCASGCGCQCITVIDKDHRVNQNEENELYSHSGSSSIDHRGADYHYFGAGTMVVDGYIDTDSSNEEEKPLDDSEEDDDDEDDYIEDSSQAIYDSYFGSASRRPDYLEAIYNHSSDYNYNIYGNNWS